MKGRGPVAKRLGAGTKRRGAEVRGLADWVCRWYGAWPLHLLALLAAFALAGYAVRGVVAAGQWRGFALWFAVAIVGHDLLLFPLYSLADLSLRRLLPGRLAGRRHDRAAGPLGPASSSPASSSPASSSPAASSPAASSPAASSPGSPEIPFSQTRIYDPRPAPASDSGPGGPSTGHSGPASSGPRQSSSGPAHSNPAHSGPAGPPVINYVRVPAAFSLLLLLVWFPLILGLSARTYHRASGLVTSPYLGRWLAVTGVLFAASAASYALALRRASAPPRQARRSRHLATSPGRRGHADGARRASRHRRRRFH